MWKKCLQVLFSVNYQGVLCLGFVHLLVRDVVKMSGLAPLFIEEDILMFFLNLH